MTSTTVMSGQGAHAVAGIEPIRAHGTASRRLGHWTTARHLDVRASRGVVTLDLLRRSEVRIYRGGVAILAAICSREYVADALQARREGRFPTIDDPSR